MFGEGGGVILKDNEGGKWYIGESLGIMEGVCSFGVRVKEKWDLEK